MFFFIHSNEVLRFVGYVRLNFIIILVIRLKDRRIGELASSLFLPRSLSSFL